MASRWDRFLMSLSPSLRKDVQRFQPYTPEEIAAMWGSGIFSGYVPQMTQSNKAETIGSGFRELAANAYGSNPIVFACMLARVQLFSEARFQFQRLKNGRPGELFAGPSTYLAPLEKPWPGGTTSALLKEALTDSDLGGNAFIARRPGQLQRLRPDWTVIIAGNPTSDATTWDLDTEILGYGYQPDGPTGRKQWEYLQRSEVAHFRPIPDPLKRYSGMSWLLPIVREIMGDSTATSHKLKYFENAATPNAAVKFDPSMTLEAAKAWKELFLKDHQGTKNAYKTLFLGGGSSIEAIGHNLQQADFSKVQAGGELRIASAAGVPPIIVGLSGGLEAATYSNYGQARRAFADLTMRPLWRDIAGALAQIINVPEDARLWFDTRDISFLQEDMMDAAAIEKEKAITIRTYLDAGFTASTAVDAVDSQDITRLRHSGLFSVQLQAPGSNKMPAGEVPGETPVGTGAAPETVPAGAVKPPPVAVAAPKMNASPVSGEVRCSSCNRLLAEVATAPFRMTCGRCKNVTESGNLIAA
jgi:phage portal protein BeeE